MKIKIIYVINMVKYLIHIALIAQKIYVLIAKMSMKVIIKNIIDN